MKPSIVFAFAVLMLGGALMADSNRTQDEAKTGAPPSSAKPIAPLAWLVGGVWTADASHMGGGMQRIETRYQWSDNNSYIRFTTHFVTDKADLKTYDRNFFWDPSSSALSLWYMDAQNAITAGPVTLSGDLMEVRFGGQDFAGKPADLRVQVVRKNNDLYRWTLAEREKTAWSELASLDYVRKQERP